MSRGEWRQRRNRLLRRLHECIEDPDLVGVWATAPVAADIGEDCDGVEVIPGPGSVVVFWFDRATRNVEVVAMDEDGARTALALAEWMRGEGASLDGMTVGSGSPEPEPFKA